MPVATDDARGLISWWRVRGGSFLALAATTSVAIVIVGWTSGLRAVMHATLVSLAIAALLPFVVAASGLLLIMGVGFSLALLTSLTGEHVQAEGGLYGLAEMVLGASRRLAPRYYRFVAHPRQRFLWALSAGALFGCLTLWGLMAALVLPGEARTVQILGQARARIEQVYRDTGEFPRPDDEGHLETSALDKETTSRGVLVDGFGRPLHYDVSGRWRLASWALVSLGFDGRAGADDLCVSGATRLTQWAQEADLAGVLRALGSGRVLMTDELAGIRALACPNR
jgi:hypothetical protein